MWLSLLGAVLGGASGARAGARTRGECERQTVLWRVCVWVCTQGLPALAAPELLLTLGPNTRRSSLAPDLGQPEEGGRQPPPRGAGEVALDSGSSHLG